MNSPSRMNQTVPVSHLPPEWAAPPRACSQMPFWFWNDELSDARIIQQIDDFTAHGVYSVVICARLGLPRSIPFLGERHLGFLRTAAQALADRDMTMMMLDEGMYASGSASGQIVAENPKLRGRGLVAVDLDAVAPGAAVHGVQVDDRGELQLTPEQEIVATLRRKANGHRISVVNTPTAKACRGVHFLEDDPSRLPEGKLPPEERLPSADLLNPEATAAFIRLVYEKTAGYLAEFVGTSFLGFFTDQPSLVGGLPADIKPGTWNILPEVNRLLGYDIRPHLLSLWFDDEPDAALHRRNYLAACQRRFDETFHKPLYDWCSRNGLQITGHADTGWDLGHQRYFHITGQDLTRNRILPGKAPDINCAAGTYEYSAMRHHGRRQCLNEYFGAYGHEHQEFGLYRWLTNWLLVRGVNQLVPHAFFHSVRGPRLDECPPDVGPHSPWWADYRRFADACSRLSWLNTDSEHVCHVAVLSRDDRVSWRAVVGLQASQVDCVLLAEEHIRHGEVTVSGTGLAIRDMSYGVLVVEEEPSPEVAAALFPLAQAGRVVRWQGADTVARIRALIPAPPFELVPNPVLRLRHLRKGGYEFHIIFNEGPEATLCEISAGSRPEWLLLPEEPDGVKPFPSSLALPSGEVCVGCSRDCLRLNRKKIDRAMDP